MQGRENSDFIKLRGSDVVLRAADPEDSARTHAVRWSVGWVEAPSRHRMWPEADADWQSRHYYREIIAEVDGVVAARVGLEAYRQPFAQLIDLSVRPDFRRMGLGELLTKTCQTEAARRGFTALFLQTEIDNHASHRLYTSQDFVPTAHTKMLRMVKFLDFPLLEEFKRTHPLFQYRCTQANDNQNAWDLEWHAYILQDRLRLRLEGAASRSENDGIGPAISEVEWIAGQGERGLVMSIRSEDVKDLQPGHHVSVEITIRNVGKKREGGVIQMALPVGVRMHSPSTNEQQSFAWELGAGEEVEQPMVLQIEPAFDNSVLWYLNYSSLPICAEVYWLGCRAQLSTSLNMAVPAPL